jgi:hypothetical protein
LDGDHGWTSIDCWTAIAIDPWIAMDHRQCWTAIDGLAGRQDRWTAFDHRWAVIARWIAFNQRWTANHWTAMAAIDHRLTVIDGWTSIA